MNVLITGPNGMIGSEMLQLCLGNPDVTNITTISRKPLPLQNPKLKQVICPDLMDLSGIADAFANQDLCLYAIGVYTGQVSRPVFREITVDLTEKIASYLRQQSPQASFCFLSGQGADRSEKSWIMFAKDKGIAENILIRLNFPRLHIFRPGYIYPVTPRTEPNNQYRLFRKLYKPLLSRIYPNIGITSLELAEAMVHTGLYGGTLLTYENRDIRKLAGELQMKKEKSGIA